ncbi:unnamed protein product [Rotaria sp. Silwood1]|nr:unnamed protein product [Rotaria sp. Silwood1]
MRSNSAYHYSPHNTHVSSVTSSNLSDDDDDNDAVFGPTTPVENQNKGLIKTPTFNSTSDHMFIQREREISDNTPRYQTLQDQSLKQERKLAIQRPFLSNFSYIKSPIPHNNISGTFSKSKIPLKQQYQVSKNVNNNIENNIMRDERSKSC